MAPKTDPCNSWIGKKVTVYNNDGSRTEKTYDKNNQLNQISVFKDIDGDGKEDLYSVTIFSSDGKPTAKTFIDKDGDGYHDEVIEREYRDNNFENLQKETRTIEEDINSVKNRDHGDWEIYNRSMQVHETGGYYIC